MENVCALLLPLSLLCVVHGEGPALAPIELAPIPCNDKAVEKLSRLAVTYINEDRTDGYKFALNRIANVHLHAQVSAEMNAQHGNVARGCCNILSVGECLVFYNRGVIVLLLFLKHTDNFVKKSHTEVDEGPWEPL